jgi:hypothetical protein
LSSIRLSEEIWPLRLTVGPLDRANGGQRLSLARLVYVVGSRAQEATIIGQSSDLGDQNTVNRPIV